VKLFLLSIIPIILIVKLNFDAILPIVVYLQFLLIWCQAEIALKQHYLFAVQFEPTFITIQTNDFLSPPSQDFAITLRIKNTSSNPAYSVAVTRVLDHSIPIMPKEWENKITRSHWINLGPNEVNVLCQITDVDYFRNKQMEILYRNQFGDFRELILLFSNDTFILVPHVVKEKGFLLNTFKEIIELPDLLFLKWRLNH
jgi:hypothetical protein